MAAHVRVGSSGVKPKPGAIGINYMQKNFTEADVLGQGYLTKIGQRWKSHKRRWFVITFQDIKYFENRDKYEGSSSSLGSISVADIQSIQQSNALNFGANTSLSIRTANRTLEVGDQKELVADSILFVLQRWLSLRDSRNDRSLPPNLSIPVIEMPNSLQRDVYRHFEECTKESYMELMQEPVNLFSWLPETRQLIRDDYSALFQKVFGCQPSKTNDPLNGYILFHGNWSPEIIIYRTSEGDLRRLCYDPEPILHFLSDHFASIQKVDLTFFHELRGIDALIKRLQQLKTDYRFVLPELVLPTHLKEPDEVTALVTKLTECMPGMQFDSSSSKTSQKILLDDGSYLLHLYSDPALVRPTVACVEEEAFPAPSSMQTMDSGSMRQLSEAFISSQSTPVSASAQQEAS